MSKYIGIKFRRHNEAYQANINIYNVTQQSYLLQNYIVDLYMYGANYRALDGDQRDNITFEYYMFWYKLDSNTDEYTVEINNAGPVTGRTYGNSPNQVGTIEYDYFLITEDMVNMNNCVDAKLVLINDITSITDEISLVKDSIVDLVKTTKFNGDGTTTKFLINGNNFAYSFYRFSTDGGVTWKYPTSFEITWGSNVDCNDDIIHPTTGHFGINFFEAPAEGIDNIVIQWYPKYTKAKMKINLKQINDGDSSFNLHMPVKLSRYVCEIIP